MSEILTDVVGRAQNFSYVRSVTDVSRYAEVAQLYIAVREFSSKYQILRLKHQKRLDKG